MSLLTQLAMQLQNRNTFTFYTDGSLAKHAETPNRTTAMGLLDIIENIFHFHPADPEILGFLFFQKIEIVYFFLLFSVF